jgi:hypothetical protein
MRTEVLTLATLAEASPKAAADFLERLNAAVQDCKQHRTDKARVVTLKVSVFPSQSDPDDVVIVPSIGAKTPAIEHNGFVARAGKGGQLKFDFVDTE